MADSKKTAPDAGPQIVADDALDQVSGAGISGGGGLIPLSPTTTGGGGTGGGTTTTNTPKFPGTSGGDIVKPPKLPA